MSLALILAVFFHLKPTNLFNGFLVNILFVLLVIGIMYILFGNRNSEMNQITIAASLVFISIMGVIFGFPIAIIFLFFNAFVMLKRERISLVNMLGFLISVAMILSIFFTLFVKFNNWPFFLRPFYFLPLIVWSIATLDALNFFSLSVIYNIRGKFFAKFKKIDFVVVLGAGLINGEKVGRLLASRISRGVEIISRNPEAKIVMSGGQGGDEKISEASAMAEFAEFELGVKKSRILLESESKTTRQNLLFSRKIITSKKSEKHPSVVFVSNNYHIARGGMFTKKLGLNWVGVGAKTKFYYLPSAWIRELIAVLRERWKSRVFVFAVMFCGFTAFILVDAIRG